jgi:hypothetical protein
VRTAGTRLGFRSSGLLRNRAGSLLLTFRDSLWVPSSRLELSKFFKDCLVTHDLGQLLGPIFKVQVVQIFRRLLVRLPTFLDSLWVPSSRLDKSKFFKDCLVTDVLGQLVDPIFKFQAIKFLRGLLVSLPTFWDSLSVQ